MSISDLLGPRLTLTRSQQITLQLYIEQFGRAFRTFAENRLAVLGTLIIFAAIVMAVFAPVLAPYPPFAVQETSDGSAAILQEPSPKHLFGTNHLARDVFSQWIYGSRVSLLIGFLSGISVMVLGTTVGLISGYYGGTLDLIVMRFVDILYGIPAIPLILVVALFMGSSVWIVIIAMMTVLWRSMARIIRAETLSVSNQPFIKTARAAGASDFRIMAVHILPNLVPIILIEGTFTIGSAIIIEAGISFLGLGASEMISWGSMLQLTFSSGAIYAWWWVIPPGVAITAVVLSFFYISRGIEDITHPSVGRR